MLGLFSADPSYILNGQDVYISCLDGFVQIHHILNGQDVYDILAIYDIRWVCTKPSKHDM
jgi:hypothetical protein